VESEPSQSHKAFGSKSSKIFFESESRHDLVELSQSESQELSSHFKSLVCKLESNENSHFFYVFFCCEMALNML